MQYTRKGMAIGLAATAGLLLTGCLVPAGPDRTNNQGGGNVITAGLKVANQQLAQLTPDEVQVIGDWITAQQEVVNLTLTEDEADALVQFLKQNNLNSRADVEALIAAVEAAIDAGQDPADVVVIPDGLLALIARIGAEHRDLILQWLGELPTQ